jgi:uroporphyrinogen-III synthase
MKFSGKVWAVGKGTARTLIDDNIVVEFSGDGSGAAVFFAKIAGECGGTFPVHKLAWISAEETAENRDNLSRLYGCEITHFPVYKTVDAHPDWDVIDTLPGPRTWLFYSAKAFRSFEAHIATADIVELHGGSAARAGADILNAVIRTIENE